MEKKSLNSLIKKVFPWVIAVFCFCGILFFMYATRAKDVYEGDRALYWDDMGCHETFTDPELTLWEKVTYLGANKVRYVTNVLMIIAWKVVGTKYDREDTILFFCNICLVAVVWICSYLVLHSKTGEKNNNTQIQNILLASGGALAYASSRFAYYSYEEFFGIMENVGNALAIIIITLLILDRFRYRALYWIAVFAWIVAYYVHERYLLLAGVLFLYSFGGLIYYKRKYKIPDFIRQFVIVLLSGLLFVQRMLLFGSRALDGTGGTSMTDTFDIGTVLRMVARQIFYLFGFNYPKDAYLNGIRFQDVNKLIILWTLIVLFIVGAIAFFFIRKVKKLFFEKFYPIIICVLAILCLMVSSSFTIRVEMRWMYASLGMEVLIVLYMIRMLISEQRGETGVYLLRMGCLFIALSIPIIETYYVGHWGRIYNHSARIDSMELSDVLDGYDYIDNLYIVVGDQSSPLSIEDQYELARAEQVEINNIIEVYYINEIESIGDDDAVFFRDASENNYIDISDQFQQTWFIEGKYDDGWTEPVMKAEAIADENDGLFISLYIPDYDIIEGEGKIYVNFNGERCGEIEVGRNWSGEVVIYGLHQGVNEIEFISDYYCISNSGRSEDGRLSYVLREISVVK